MVLNITLSKFRGSLKMEIIGAKSTVALQRLGDSPMKKFVIIISLNDTFGPN
jgi:hypothetical protein